MRFESPGRRSASTAVCGLVAVLSIVAVPVAPAAGVPVAHTAPATPVTMSLGERRLSFGERVSARGVVRHAGAGVPVVLEHRLRSGAWVVLARGLTADGGAYRLSAAALASGLVRVSAVAAGASASVVGAPPVTSRERGLRVAAAITVRGARISVRAGGLVRVTGVVRPAEAGRLVVLQRRSGHGWRTIARTRTRVGGRYTLRTRPRSAQSSRLRVRTAASPALAAGVRRAGRLNVFRPALASWYGSGQRLACGGLLTAGMMGVAHKTLPCGTMVTIRYDGRQVRVPVVDRGPYAGGREWDLGPGVRAALGFEGVGTVWVAH